MRMVFSLSAAIMFFTGSFVVSAADNVNSSNNKLFYSRPAPENRIEQSYLPIGNGYFGAMVRGGIAKEILSLNVDSLWTGDESQTGAYQKLGTLTITFPGLNASTAKSYTRTLDIGKAVHTVEFKANGGQHTRTYFCDYPDKVMVLIFSSTTPQDAEIVFTDATEWSWMTPKNKAKGEKREYKKGKTKTFYRSRKSSEVSVKGNAITLDGELENGLKFYAEFVVRAPKGTVSSKGDRISIKGAKNFAIVFSTDTDYKMSYKDHWKKSTPPKELVKAVLAKAALKKVSALMKTHESDYRSLYDDFYLKLGDSPAKFLDMPTNTRLKTYKTTFQKTHIVEDPRLEELVAKYGRYLLISSSRPGSLPANLQGLWNWSNSPPWRSDYHSNINIQMNYWLAEPAGLSKCFMPFSDYIMAMRDIHLVKTPKAVKHPNGKKATRGWAIKTENNIFGAYSFVWNFPGAAWYGQHLWEHYAFTNDKTYLKNVAYPVLKETCQFWEDRLKKRPDGTLVVPTGWSPEHGPKEDGVTYDQEIVYDLFTNYIEAAKELGMDKDYRKRIEAMRSHLLPLKIGKWGQLQEWETDRDNPKDQHRHVSHLFGLHPGRQISPFLDKKFFDAAIVSLKARGDGGTGWSKAWKINFWARCHDGNHAHKMIAEQLSNNFYENLFDYHAPFQIDGNFGNTSGVLEMLLQSQVRAGKGTDDKNASWIIQLLPSLPDAWKDGEVRGIRARGNVTVDLKWSGGKLTSATFKGKPGSFVLIAYNDKKRKLQIPAKGVLTVSGAKFN
jgi:alpha-L-fucosidase 2